MIVAIFRSRVRAENEEEYYRRADQMTEIATGMPGFISVKDFKADDGERVSIHEWESAAHLKAWREHPAHVRMQQYGRDHFYEEYTLYVCDSPRTSHFVMQEREGATQQDD